MLLFKWNYIFLLATIGAGLPILGAASESDVGEGNSLYYHPGHLASHITRLHRYDHSGQSAMIEAEARWLRRDGLHPPRASGLVENTSASIQLSNTAGTAEADAEEAEELSIFRVSAAQADALRRHHASVLARAKGAFNQDAKSASWWPLNLFESLIGGSSGPKPTSDSASALEIAKKKVDQNTSIHVEAYGVLNQLGSQYVGPIGVGTIKAPSFCQLSESNLRSASILQTNGGTTLQDLSSLSMEETTLLDLSALDLEDSVKEAIKGGACRTSSSSTVFVVFDTGSTNLWVASDLCDSGSCVKEGRHRYDHKTSSTYEDPPQNMEIRIRFGTGQLEGYQAVDDFYIGPFSIKKQTFGMISATRGNVFDDVPFEGILGLAFPSMSANGVRPFFDTVIDEASLKHNEFAFYLHKDDPAANAVLWGGVDPRLYEGKIEFFPVADPYYWSLSLHSFLVGKDVLFGQGAPVDNGRIDSNASLLQELSTGEQPAYAIVDTGTTYFSAEGAVFDDIMRRIPSGVACNKFMANPDITFRLASASGQLRNYTFEAKDYAVRSSAEADAQCYTPFMELPIPKAHGPGMVLGEVFLRRYLTVFDRGSGAPDVARLGFARSVHTTHAKQHLRDVTDTQPSFYKDRKTVMMQQAQEGAQEEEAASGDDGVGYSTVERHASVKSRNGARKGSITLAPRGHMHASRIKSYDAEKPHRHERSRARARPNNPV